MNVLKKIRPIYTFAVDHEVFWKQIASYTSFEEKKQKAEIKQIFHGELNNNTLVLFLDHTQFEYPKLVCSLSDDTVHVHISARMTTGKKNYLIGTPAIVIFLMILERTQHLPLYFYGALYFFIELVDMLFYFPARKKLLFLFRTNIIKL